MVFGSWGSEESKSYRISIFGGEWARAVEISLSLSHYKMKCRFGVHLFDFGDQKNVLNIFVGRYKSDSPFTSNS